MTRVLYLYITCILIFAPSAFADAPTPKLYEPLQMRVDDAAEHAAERLSDASHISVYLPSLAYIYISHAINGALIRPANNERGWDYDLAVAHQQIDDTTYEFSLRKGVTFQDGTPFNAKSIVLNMRYFKRKPPQYSKIQEFFKRVKKIDEYTVQFQLREKYGMFMNDLIWIQFYSPDYLLKYGWNGKPTVPNLAAPGPYGLGPYILKEGYVEGDRQTAIVELAANPLYWDKRYPKIKRVTVYTELASEEVARRILYEDSLDIAPIDFTQKVETLLSPYAKLIVSPSTDNYAIHINMRTGQPKLREQHIRVALNQALHQTNLLRFVYEREGQLSPTLAAPGFPGVKEAMKTLKPYSIISDPYQAEEQARLRDILNGLTLKVLTQAHFMPLWRGIEHQLQKVGVTLHFNIVNNEKDLFAQLLSTNAGLNTIEWDLLSWAADDWFFSHPWSAFFVYRTYNYWSTLTRDAVMDGYIDDLFRTGIHEAGFNDVVLKIMQRAYDYGYMLFVPTPNKVFAVNKEVIFKPYKQACLPLWEIEISKRHRSQRKGEYPLELKHPVELVKTNF
jgi:peptide/nickel transport system substrate-binding protein